MGIFCQTLMWWERKEPEEGACGRGSFVSSPAEAVSSPAELAFEPQSQRTASAWSQQWVPAVVGWSFPCVYLIPWE